MTKRANKVQDAVSAINELLALDNVYITQEDGSMAYAPSSDPKAQLFKQGICEAMEALLRKSKSYNGYMFLDPLNYETSKKFDRKYF